MNERIQKYIKGIITISVIISAISFLIIFLINGLLSLKSVLSIVGTITFIVFVLFSIYNKYIWKTAIAFWEKTPVLFNSYEGYIYSSYNNFLVPLDCKLKVKQTLLKISIIMFSNESKSKSIISNIIYENDEWVVYFIYINEPSSTTSERSGIHYGSAKLDISNPNCIKGNYWTDRKTIGEINLVEQGKKENICHPDNVLNAKSEKSTGGKFYKTR